jgi:hypothetical protein
MPLTHCIDLHERLVFVTLSGILSLEDILAWRDVVFGEPASVRRFCQLVDTTRATNVNVPLQTLARFASTSFFEPKTPRAYLAAPGASMDVARLLSGISAVHGYETAIFTSTTRIHVWLASQRDRSDVRWLEERHSGGTEASPPASAG